jgi:membrane protease YdiL (CAAX protease family)
MPEGYIVLLSATVAAFWMTREFFREIFLIAIAVAVLGVAPINADVSVSHAAALLAITMGLLIAPFLIFKYLYKDDDAIPIKFGGGQRWGLLHLLYFLLTVAIGYLFIPFYLTNSGAYQNWPSTPDSASTIRLFFGTNYLGLWDELFFICTILTIFRRHFKFWIANILNSIIFTAFLYELGFRSYGPFFIAVFTLLQGYIYMRTNSLPYVITIHLTFDMVLFFALVHAHDPSRFNFFIT